MKVLVINGPNLNMLGRREPGTYGSATLENINNSLRNLAEELGVEIDFEQSNHEGELVTIIQNCTKKRIDGILINPGAYGHTSIALRDALLAVNLPFVEVHISNTFARESFRHQSYITDISAGLILGFGPVGYLHALRAIHQILTARHIALADEITEERAVKS